MRNMDAENATRTERPRSETEPGRFQDRLKEAIGSRSMRDFALKSGVSPSVLRAYLAGESEPGREALVAMARESGYSVGWLATGEGFKRADEIREAAASYGEPIDWELLQNVIGAVDKLTADEPEPVSPAAKANLTRRIYTYYREKAAGEGADSARDMAMVMEIVRAALKAGVSDGETVDRGNI